VDLDDKIVVLMVLVDVMVLVMAALTGFLVDLALTGRRWTRWRLSARSVALLCVCAVGVVTGIVGAPLALAIGVPVTVVAPAGPGPWALAFGGALSFALSRAIDRKRISARPDYSQKT
jgi:hypothetical protein